MSSSEARSGRCAIVGRANVGKSTLLNALLGQKLAIATAKPQTTRNCILGLYVRPEPPLQIAFVDTPGMHEPENALGRALLEQAKAGLADADVIVLMVQVGARPMLHDVLGPHERELIDIARRDGRPVVLALNKIDRVADKPLLLPLLEECGKTQAFAAMVPISARNGTGLPALIDEVGALMPPGLRYNPELLTDKPERFFAAELVREAVIRNTRQELPYTIAVSVEEFSDTERLCSISAVVVVSKDAHKGIIIGKGGQRLKTIGSEARAEIEAMLQRKVFLKLWVIVTPDWTNNPERVRELLTRDAEAIASP
jgi:GTP-binding protein Era